MKIIDVLAAPSLKCCMQTFVKGVGSSVEQLLAGTGRGREAALLSLSLGKRSHDVTFLHKERSISWFTFTHYVLHLAATPGTSR